MWVCHLGKAVFTAPVYISIAWSLIITYQVFTLTAVHSLIGFLASLCPSLAAFMTPRISMVTFIHAFAWVFVLSSVIPVIILGKSRSVLLQFFLCLTVTLVAVSIEDILIHMMGTAPTAQMQVFSVWFQNPLIAGLYLSVPYVLMLYLDIHARKKGGQGELEEWKAPRTESLDEFGKGEPETTEAPTLHRREQNEDPHSQNRPKLTFLYGASVACFLLSVAVFWFGEAIFGPVLPMTHKLVYTAIFAALGAMLLIVGFSAGRPQEGRAPWKGQAEGQREPADYPTPHGGGLARIGKAPQESVEPPSQEETAGVEVQISDQYYQLRIERYDVLHPKSVVDSQC
jgi:hypothetical protein